MKAPHHDKRTSIARFLSALTGGLAGLMALRFVHRLLIANPDNPVTAMLYAISRPLLLPWGTLWPPSSLPGLAVERATLVAAASYLLVSLILGLASRCYAYPQRGDNLANRKENAR